MEASVGTCQQDMADRPMLIVDMNSGSYWNNKTGHEVFNLERNAVDGRFYGYCPPQDGIDITRLGAKASDESVSGVTVVYTAKRKNSSDREIIAFCEQATVHRKGVDDRKLKRFITEGRKRMYCTYTIESDTLIDLRAVKPKFVIHLADYKIRMFRMQRVFKGTYPELDRNIRAYLRTYLNGKEADDDFSYQEEIQNAEERPLHDTLHDEPQYLTGSHGQIVNRNPGIAKRMLSEAKYRCAIHPEHETFTTSKGVPYMEAHHLIPCTCSNASHFWKKQQCNIDSASNIVCLCPTCHRKIHYASDEEKRAVIEQLYKKQQDKLHEAGIPISLEELLKLYRISRS